MRTPLPSGIIPSTECYQASSVECCAPLGVTTKTGVEDGRLRVLIMSPRRKRRYCLPNPLSR